MRSSLLLLAGALVACAPSIDYETVAAPGELNWNAVETETLEHFQALLRMDTREQFFVIADALAKLENHTLKAGIAQTIFGRTGQDLLPEYPPLRHLAPLVALQALLREELLRDSHERLVELHGDADRNLLAQLFTLGGRIRELARLARRLARLDTAAPFKAPAAQALAEALAPSPLREQVTRSLDNLAASGTTASSTALALTAATLAGEHLGSSFKNKKMGAGLIVIAIGIFLYRDAHKLVGSPTDQWLEVLRRDPANAAAFHEVRPALAADAAKFDAALTACLTRDPGACPWACRWPWARRAAARDGPVRQPPASRPRRPAP